MMIKDKLSVLYNLYYNEAMLYTCALARNTAVAEDIVMEAFYKAVMAKDMEGESFKFWLLRVCKNLFLDYVKKEKHKCKLTENVIGSDGDEMLGRIIKNEQYAALYRAIGLLNDEQRELITLFYFDRLSANEIGKLVNKTEEYVRVLLMRARNKLKEIMEV